MRPPPPSRRRHVLNPAGFPIQGACFNIVVWYHTLVVQTKKLSGSSGASASCSCQRLPGRRAKPAQCPRRTKNRQGGKIRNSGMRRRRSMLADQMMSGYSSAGRIPRALGLPAPLFSLPSTISALRANAFEAPATLIACVRKSVWYRTYIAGRSAPLRKSGAWFRRRPRSAA